MLSHFVIRKKKSGRSTLEETGDDHSENAIIREEICLEFGHTYNFMVFDSFGDGMCCFEGQGSYSLTVNNVTIHTGGNFNASEEIGFKFDSCTNDVECDDGNEATDDYCVSNASTCIYFPKKCTDYGAMFSVNLTTDDRPRETSWSVTDENGLNQFNGGPYEQAENDYFYQQCLAVGAYNFTIYDSNFDGLDDIR